MSSTNPTPPAETVRKCSDIVEIKIGNYTYSVKDIRPKLNEWYIDLFVTSKERSVQIHTEKRHLINHKKDYRFTFCFKIIKSNNPNLKLNNG